MAWWETVDWSDPINRDCSLNYGLVGAWLPTPLCVGGSRLSDLGNRYDGTLTNGPTWVPTQSGIGVKTDGSNDYVSFGTVPYSGEVSFFCDIINGTTAVDSAYRSIASRHLVDGSASDWFLYAHGSGAVSVDFPWVVGNVATTSNGVFVSGERRTWGVVRSGSTGSWTVKIYRDGVQVASGTTASNPNTGSHPLKLAALSSSSKQTENTYLNAHYWSRALSANEAALYHDNCRNGFPDMLNHDAPSMPYSMQVAGGVTAKIPYHHLFGSCL